MFQFILLSLFLNFPSLPQEELSYSSLKEKEVEFVGVNFSKAKFIGTSHFTSGKVLVNDHIPYWNDYILNQYHKNNINDALDLEEIINRNSICGNSFKKIDPYALITDDPYRLRSDQVQECIDELDYTKVDKLGICFVVESFDFNNQTMTIWFTLVDMQKNQVFFQKKLVTAVSKGSGRDLWANGITKFINKTLTNSCKSWS